MQETEQNKFKSSCVLPPFFWNENSSATGAFQQIQLDVLSLAVDQKSCW